ncbi:MAG: tyrosine-type recombinase/integrase [Mycobacterium sp.]|uniref:tyrosine-type recombinase/integrase n=1 Tax=Mycobacterium sp. TaxID=1785 RepID=UPI00261B01A5|nr:tyrosine-type recombinase/integrase [Mycobacterium sp.]MDI3314503.1 tyrosine-type recombinase/integrase [Mycobacterium sp.]
MSAARHHHRHLALVVPAAGSGDDDGELSALERWELYMRGAGRSNRTINETLGVLRRLEKFAGAGVESVRPLDIARFLGRPNLKPNSRAAYYGYIHSFYRWLGQNGGTNAAAQLPRPKPPKGVPRPITDEQLQNLLAVRMHHRTRVMILLAAFAGLRVHEIAKIRGEDVDPQARTLWVTGKGNVTAILPLHPLLVEAAETMPRRGWWFPGNARRRGQPIRPRGVADIIGQAMDRAGIPGGTAHRLRHWYGTRLVSDGTDLRTAQTLLRHANLNTTAIYTRVSDARRTEAINRLAADGARAQHDDGATDGPR